MRQREREDDGMGEHTPEQIMQGITKALKARDWDAVAGLLKRLAAVDPVKAEFIYDLILTAAEAKAPA